MPVSRLGRSRREQLDLSKAGDFAGLQLLDDLILLVELELQTLNHLPTSTAARSTSARAAARDGGEGRRGIPLFLPLLHQPLRHFGDPLRPLLEPVRLLAQQGRERLHLSMIFLQVVQLLLYPPHSLARPRRLLAHLQRSDLRSLLDDDLFHLLLLRAALLHPTQQWSQPTPPRTPASSLGT